MNSLQVTAAAPSLKRYDRILLPFWGQWGATLCHLCSPDDCLAQEAEVWILNESWGGLHMNPVSGMSAPMQANKSHTRITSQLQRVHAGWLALHSSQIARPATASQSRRRAAYRTVGFAVSTLFDAVAVVSPLLADVRPAQERKEGCPAESNVPQLANTNMAAGFSRMVQKHEWVERRAACKALTHVQGSDHPTAIVVFSRLHAASKSR